MADVATQEALFGTESPEFVSYDVDVKFIDDIEQPVQVDGGFLASLRDTGGPIIPLLLRRREVSTDGPFRYTVIEGRRRLCACAMLNITSVPARIVTNSTWGDDSVLAFVANEHRSENPVIALDKLEDLVRRGWDLEKISRYARVKPRVLHRYLSLATLIPPMRALFSSGSLEFATARKAAKLAEPEQAALFEFLSAKSQLRRDVNAKIDELARPKTDQGGLFARAELEETFKQHMHALKQIGSWWGTLVDAPIQNLVRTLTTEREYRLRRIDEQEHGSPPAVTSPPVAEDDRLPAPANGEHLTEPINVGGGPTQVMQTYDGDDAAPL